MHFLINLIFIMRKRWYVSIARNWAMSLKIVKKWLLMKRIRQGNIVVEDNRLYVATTLITKKKDPTWYIDTWTT